MKNKALQYIRFLVACSVGVLCILAFYQKVYPFSIFDIEFTPSLQSGLISGLSLSAFLFILVIFLTLIFGRLYCGCLCPLGIYQELLTILFKPFYKKRKFKIQKHYVFSYILAALLFGFLFGGTVIFLRTLDPYSLALNALSGAAFGLGFISFLTVLVFFKKRFFCTNICPVGAVLGFISRFSLFKIRIDFQKCKTCGLCALKCPCGAIDVKNHTVNNETCIKCFNCLSHCNHGALSYGLPSSKKVEFNFGRRQLLKAGFLFVLFGAAYKAGIQISQKTIAKIKNVILPAGSGSVKDFSNRCLNCNLCVQNCPMNIIKKATLDIPFVHLDLSGGYCDYECHKCSSVCPSGAIKRISLKEKQKTKIATAVVDESACVKCGLCAHTCPRKIIIKEEDEFPIISFDSCIGCGACANICPVKAIKIEPIKEQIILK